MRGGCVATPSGPSALQVFAYRSETAAERANATLERWESFLTDQGRSAHHMMLTLVVAAKVAWSAAQAR